MADREFDRAGTLEVGEDTFVNVRLDNDVFLPRGVLIEVDRGIDGILAQLALDVSIDASATRSSPGSTCSPPAAGAAGELRDVDDMPVMTVSDVVDIFPDVQPAGSR